MCLPTEGELIESVGEEKRTEGAQCPFEWDGKVTKDKEKGSEGRIEAGGMGARMCVDALRGEEVEARKINFW